MNQNNQVETLHATSLQTQALVRVQNVTKR